MTDATQISRQALLGEIAALRAEVARLRDTPEGRPEDAGARYRSLIEDVLEHSKVGTFILDADFRVAWINRAIEHYFGLRRDDVLGRDKRHLIETRIRDAFADPDDFARRVLATYDDNTYVENFECHVLPAEGRDERWLEHWSQPITSGPFAGGRVEHYTDVTDRRRGEEARRLTIALIASSDDAIITKTLDGTITSWNPAAERIYGYTPAEAVGQSILLIVPEDRHTEITAIHERIARGEHTEHLETVRRARDGRLLNISLTVSPIEDAGGEIVAASAIARDVTPRKRAEAAQRETEARLRRLFEQTPAFISLHEGPEHVYAFANAQHRRIVGDRALIGRPAREAIPEVIGQGIFGLLDRVYATGEPFARNEVSITFDRTGHANPDDAVEGFFDLIIQPLRDDEGQIEGTMTFAYEVTEQVRARAALRELNETLEARVAERTAEVERSEALLRQAERLARLGAWAWNLDTNEVRWSDGMKQLFGYDPETFDGNLGALLEEAIHPEDRDRVRRVTDQVRETGHPEPVEYRIVRPNGSVRTIYAEAALVRDEAGRPARMVGTVQDVTARKKAEAKIRKLNRILARRAAALTTANRQLKNFSYSVSHDLRAPLRAVNGFAQILGRRHRDDLGEEGQRYLDNIIEAGTRMSQLIDDLLAYSRLESRPADLRPTDLGTALGHAAQNVELRLGELGATLRLPEAAPTVRGNPALLERLFTNLFDNALTYHRDGVPPRLDVRLGTADGRVVVTVEDNGLGIPEEHREKIFDLFQQLHSADTYGGTGIGLAIVRQAAQMMHGRVWAEAAPEHGTIFRVELPLAAPPAEPPTSARP